LDYTTIPLLNTVVLLTSALTVTVSHSSLLSSSVSSSLRYLMLTVLLGVFFTTLQAYEYHLSSYTISDSSYGSSFFLATGFHGFHVMVGTLWLSVSLPRLSSGHYSPTRHFCLEGSIWYWHFVDVI
jgi:heme/copper-type cytochrome/quinol oxidase subunit 3